MANNNYRNGNNGGNNGNGGNGGNHTRNNVDVDYSAPGAITPSNSLNALLNYAMQNQQSNQIVPTRQTGMQTYEPQQLPSTEHQVYSQPVEVRYVNRPPVTKPIVPSIEIPYTEIWKANRLHPQNSWRYFWYPYYTILTYLASPVGICITAALIFLGGLNFMLNGSYQGPGYVSKQKIEVIPKQLPQFATPVIDVVE
jgi:hypothetical protein